MQIQKPRQGYKLVQSLFGKYEEIPDDWNEVRQGEVCQFINGYAYSQSEFREKGYPIIRIQNLTGGNNFVYSDVELPEKQFATDGDLLFAWSATFGPFIWHGPKAAFHYHQWKVIPNENTNKEFLYYHLVRISSTVKQMGQSGLGMFHMTKNGMERMPMFLPPLNQQQKIASILSNVDSSIQQTQKEIEQTQRLKKGLMQKLLTKGIGHTKFKKVKLFSNNTLEIPSEWNVHKINELIKNEGDIKTGPFGSNLLEDELVNEGIRVFYPEDIENYKIFNYGGKCITYDKYKQLKNYRVQSGDVIISLMGTIGKVAVVPNNIQDSIISKHLLKITLDKNLCTSQYLVILLSSTLMQIQMTSFSQGLTMQGLNTKIIRNLLCIIPSIHEQQKIASILSNVDSQIQKQQEYKSNLENIKKGLMQKLLTGQIRVKV